MGQNCSRKKKIFGSNYFILLTSIKDFLLVFDTIMFLSLGVSCKINPTLLNQTSVIFQGFFMSVAI